VGVKPDPRPEEWDVLRQIVIGVVVMGAVIAVGYLLDAPERQDRRELAKALERAEAGEGDRGLVRMNGPPTRVSDRTP